MVKEIINEVQNMTVRFGDVEKKISDAADCVGYIVESKN